MPDAHNPETDFPFMDDHGESLEVDGNDPYSNTLWLSLSCDSQDPRINDAVQHLMEHHEFSGHQKFIRKSLKCILVNIRRLLRAEKHALLYQRGHGYYSEVRDNRLD